MPLPEVIGRLFENATLDIDSVKPLLPTYSHLLISALFPIYIGAHASLTRPESAQKPKKTKTRASENSQTKGEREDSDNSEDEDDVGDQDKEPAQKMEGLEASDAIMFPITAGLILAGFYFLLKWLKDASVLNKFLGWYFSQAGLFFTVAFVRDGLSILRSIVFPSRYSWKGVEWKVNTKDRCFRPISQISDIAKRSSPLPSFLGNIPISSKLRAWLWDVRELLYKKTSLRVYIRSLFLYKGHLTVFDILSGGFAVAIVGYFTFVAKYWWLTNVLGFAFSYGALQFMSPTTFVTGSLILCSLFLYDIYFVFFTPLMVTVATKLDVPIKLLFPRPPSPGQDPGVVSLAMLGLGDIVIPGMVIGLALRFDLYIFYLKRQFRGETQSHDRRPSYIPATGGWGERLWTRSSVAPEYTSNGINYFTAKTFPKTYFYASICGYLGGLVTTLLAMQISSHPQPALLYLVPGVLSSLWGTALVKGDLREMWNFSDAFEEEDPTENTKADKEKAEKPKDKKQTARGLLSKAFFGDDPKNDSKDKKKADKEREANSPGGELFTFSIYLPEKKTQKEAKPSEEHKKADQSDKGETPESYVPEHTN